MKRPSVTPESIWKRYAKIAQRNLSDMPKIIRPVVTTYSAQGIIDIGGFPHFFESDWPGADNWKMFAEDFDAVGHEAGAEAIRAALCLFPGGQPQTDLKERRGHIFETLGGLDGELGKLDSAICGKSAVLDRLLARYIEAHEIV